MELSATELWSRVLESARASLPDQSFRTWLAGSTALALSEDELHVEAASQFHVEWVEDKFGVALEEIIGEVLGRPLRLVFRSADPGAGPRVPAIEVVPEPPGTSEDQEYDDSPHPDPGGGLPPAQPGGHSGASGRGQEHSDSRRGSRAGPGGHPAGPPAGQPGSHSGRPVGSHPGSQAGSPPGGRAGAHTASPSGGHTGGSAVGAPVRPLAHSLNERYTFERFVVGNNNQFAAAACHAVAEKPALMYNPLFLYGGVGLGKTHLMHAIGHHILSHDPSRRVSYVPSEQFMNELVTAIQEGTTAQFRRRYRQMDLLLVDDIHFLEGKERTQEEFFHTFNALYDAQKQIVLTSDRPPNEMPGLEQRLISRFEWGLVADIKLPDFETRVAILRKKASDDALTLDDEVIDYIARSCTSSVRELEGAVIKLLAYSSLTNQEMNVSLAKASLEGIIRSGARNRAALDPERIRDAVARKWNVAPEALASKRRTKDLTVPRQVAMYLIKELLHRSLVDIGDLFGGRDHSTVIHSIRKVDERLAADPEYRGQVEQVKEELARDAGGA